MLNFRRAYPGCHNQGKPFKLKYSQTRLQQTLQDPNIITVSLIKGFLRNSVTIYVYPWICNYFDCYITYLECIFLFNNFLISFYSRWRFQWSFSSSNMSCHYCLCISFEFSIAPKFSPSCISVTETRTIHRFLWGQRSVFSVCQTMKWSLIRLMKNDFSGAKIEKEKVIRACLVLWQHLVY